MFNILNLRLVYFSRDIKHFSNNQRCECDCYNIIVGVVKETERQKHNYSCLQSSLDKIRSFCELPDKYFSITRLRKPSD